MYFGKIACVAFLTSVLASGAAAMTVGQPFLTAEADATGTVLDFFDFGEPSGVRQIDVSATITETVGAPGLVGKTLAFRSNVGAFTSEAEFTLGTTVIDGFDIFDSGTGFYDYDAFTAGPGDLNLTFSVLPPFVDTPNAIDPLLFDVVYGGDFSEYPDKIGVNLLQLELVMSIYLDGPLPMRIFERTDPDTGDVIDTFDFVEGILSIERITLGLVGGEPVPVIPPIPLPASLPLLVAGLGGLGLARRRAGSMRPKPASLV